MATQNYSLLRNTPLKGFGQWVGNTLGVDLTTRNTRGSSTATPLTTKEVTQRVADDPYKQVNAPVGSTGYSAPTATATQANIDPYAAYGGTARVNSLMSGFNSQKQGILDTVGAAARNSGLGLQGSILDFIDSLRSGQNALDNRGINNELAKQRGAADVNRTVNQGIRSGGVTLNNRNATDSSAAEQIARTYGDIGRRAMSDIGNQYETENIAIGMEQDDLDRQRASGLRRFDLSTEQAVESIVADASQKLAQLDAAMLDANLPQRLALDQEKNNIRAQVQGILNGYRGDLVRANEIRAMDQNARVSEATRRGSLGQAPEAMFDYSASTPGALEGTGPVASELPIFTYRRDER